MGEDLICLKKIDFLVWVNNNPLTNTHMLPAC